MNKTAAVVTLLAATGALAGCGGGSSTASKTTAVKSSASSAAASPSSAARSAVASSQESQSSTPSQPSQSSATSAQTPDSAEASIPGQITRLTAPTEQGTPFDLSAVAHSSDPSAAGKACQTLVGKPSDVAKKLGYTLRQGADVWTANTDASSPGQASTEFGEPTFGANPKLYCRVLTVESTDDSPHGNIQILFEKQTQEMPDPNEAWAGNTNNISVKIEPVTPMLEVPSAQQAANDWFNAVMTKG